MNQTFASLGLHSDEELTAPPGNAIGRLVIMHSDEADAIWVDAQGEECSGRLRLARTLDLKPVAGDWIATDGERVTKVFPRRSELRRTQTHGRPAQVLAANIDVVFIVVPLHSELHQRMVEGLTAMAVEAGVHPILVITKIDEGAAVEEIASLKARMAALVGDVEQVATSAHTGAGIEELRGFLGVGVSGVLLGASGAGKTSLLNALEGSSEFTKSLSRTGEGRHATSTRKLYRLSSGGVILDIPGIRFSRAVADGAGIAPDFSDIEELALSCEFTNCGHGTDRGCAVTAAVADGTLSPERQELWRQQSAGGGSY
jgi:ribosome biogenesis GTPase / thiamine phosphate phosphatase